jgi:TetR/AcrR family transcriptional repressor of nem operon
MARDGKPTKDKILTESKNLVLRNGFSGTSIDNILAATGITKGAFFYHFKTKNALAKALMEVFVIEDIAFLNEALKQTEHLEGDSLARLLQFTQQFIDAMADLSEPPPGCLYASYLSETDQFDEEIIQSISKIILKWRNTLEDLLQKVLEEYDTQIDVDITSLANLLNVIFEGSYVISKAVNEAALTAKQLTHLKNYFQLLFVKKK